MKLLFGGIIFLLFLLLFLSIKSVIFIFDDPVAQDFHPSPSPSPIKTSLNRDVLWNEIQDWRIKNGFKPYEVSDELCEFAALRIEDIKLDFNHSKFYERSQTLLKGRQNKWVAENLAADSSSERDVIIHWENSPSHKKNLDMNAQYSCLETSGTYAVQIFSNF